MNIRQLRVGNELACPLLQVYTRPHRIGCLILQKSRCAELVDGLFEAIKKTLESGEDVLIGGFGEFSVKERNKRRTRNPATGKALIPDARKDVTFKCTSVLKKRINWKDA